MHHLYTFLLCPLTLCYCLAVGRGPTRGSVPSAVQPEEETQQCEGFTMKRVTPSAHAGPEQEAKRLKTDSGMSVESLHVNAYYCQANDLTSY